MAAQAKNSLDLLRLLAASLVLYSHQHVLLGLPDPSFFGWNSFGGAGVSIFFFLSGFLVWSSWARDANLRRFFQRRALRIFPALLVLVVATVFCFGPILSDLSLPAYFAATETWRYLSIGDMVILRGLPGVFANNPYPHVMNGSLWTLPVEIFSYVSVALLGCIRAVRTGWSVLAGFSLALLIAAVGTDLAGERFVTHFEMVALFWWGVLYAYLSKKLTISKTQLPPIGAVVALGLAVFFVSSPRGLERTAMLLFAAGLVIFARRFTAGAHLTDRLGDLSYGMYIFAFPVQQWLVEVGRSRGWPFLVYLSLSFLLTSTLAYASWHLIEKRALGFKPRSGVVT
ncbi:MAG: acyltransferase [Comamonadaceae bacterium]|nr:acyltransferase [Comamonadaceae bacterium]